MTSQGTVLAPVYPSIGYEELSRLLREDGYALEPVAHADRPTYHTLVAPRFTIWLDTPVKERPGEFCLITLWTRIPLPAPLRERVVLDMQWRSMFAHCIVDRRDNLVVTQAIVVNGGVTEYYLKNQFWHWRQDLERLRQVVRLNLAKHTGRVLH